MRTLGFLLSFLATMFFTIQGATYYDIVDESTWCLLLATVFAFSTGFCLSSLLKAIERKRQIQRNIERVLA